MRPEISLLSPDLIDRVLDEAFQLLQNPGFRLYGFKQLFNCIRSPFLLPETEKAAYDNKTHNNKRISRVVEKRRKSGSKNQYEDNRDFKLSNKE